MSIEKAKVWLKRFLASLEKNPSLSFNAYRVLNAYSIARNRKDLMEGLKGKSEDELHAFFNRKNIAVKIAELVDYKLNEDKDVAWV